MQEDTRARMRTGLTPIAEYQMEETSYKSDKKKLIIPKFVKRNYWLVVFNHLIPPQGLPAYPLFKKEVSNPDVGCHNCRG